MRQDHCSLPIVSTLSNERIIEWEKGIFLSMSISVMVLFLRSGYDRISEMRRLEKTWLPAPISTIFANTKPPILFSLALLWLGYDSRGELSPPNSLEE